MNMLFMNMKEPIAPQADYVRDDSCVADMQRVQFARWTGNISYKVMEDLCQR